MNGLPYTAQDYLNHVVTNEDESPSATMMQDFAQEVSDAGPDNIQDVITKWMDIEKAISYAVVDRTIRADDGAFHWYCGNGGCSNHNYYWYEEPGLNKLYLIPWDMDNTFENLLINANPVTPIPDGWGEITNDCEPFSYGFLGLKQRSAACDKLTAGWVTFGDEYNQRLIEFLEGPFSETNVDALLDTWKEQITAATVEASEMHNDALTVDQWETAIAKLKSELATVRGN